MDKRVTLWEQPVLVEGAQRPLRRVLRLIEQTVDKHGQILIEPQLTLEGWTTSLGALFSSQSIVALYADMAHMSSSIASSRPIWS